MTTYDSRIRPRRSRNLCGSRTATSWGCIFRQIHTGIAHHYSSHRLHFRLKQQKNTPHLEGNVTGIKVTPKQTFPTNIHENM